MDSRQARPTLHLLLKRETVARMITQWELALQSQMLAALRLVHDGGATGGVIRHLYPGRVPIAQFTLSVAQVRDGDYEADEVELELSPEPAFAGSSLLWQATVRFLISISPPEQGWDRDRNSFRTIAEPDTFTARVGQLERLADENELGDSEPGMRSHYAHRQHLAGHAIEGTAVRALGGVFLVPTQDHGG